MGGGGLINKRFCSPIRNEDFYTKQKISDDLKRMKDIHMLRCAGAPFHSNTHEEAMQFMHTDRIEKEKI